MALIANNLNIGPRPPAWFGARHLTYNDYLTTSAAIVATDFFADYPDVLNPRDLIWCNLNDGYFTLRMVTPTTAEIATD